MQEAAYGATLLLLLMLDAARESGTKYRIMYLLVLMIALGFTIGTTVLASRKGRNPVNWFFLSLFWGAIGLIILACSKDLDKTKGERDTLAKVLWLVIIIPIVLIVAVLFFLQTTQTFNFRKA